ncbi:MULTISPECIES: sodium/glutamate symporter [Clostridium]|uniref:sodium/glutamate symporter n=1 Tax=Clostridium TaxID=1485 RepID=UPI00290E5F6C|nr:MULTISPECIES: sodium/glutamate symporter [Clostridium]MDU4476831.1 sodium/glutamate symporter [Clostridium sp.]
MTITTALIPFYLFYHIFVIFLNYYIFIYSFSIFNCSIKLWHLINLALPMLLLLLSQCIMMYIYGIFVSYRLMGKNYDSAVMVAGLTGFAMGSTSNAMANMNSVTEKYVYSRIAFFIVPIVGSLFIDFINIGIIYGFISFLS